MLMALPLRRTAWLAAPLALSACAGSGRPAAAPHVAKPGYACDVGVAFEDGAWAHATLDAEGRQLSARWDWKAQSAEPFLRFWAANSVEGPRPLRVGDGYALVQWGVPVPYRQRPSLWRLELRVDPESRYWSGSGFVGDYARTGDYRLMASWPDLLAFARGAPRLWVVLRDGRAAIAKRAEVDPGIFARGEAEIARTLEALARKAADFRQSCQPVDDIEPNEIVIS